ncbi:hypothetical protein PoB_007605100 [Plakobranchus ocellatus]|uniref:Uncharacterized protein n=1 Tax=Plakobranchus ocellatus TaxID=259542 RepID=A0AAV4E0C3_9GAST|nr:hypothetical protein PoB_007605100 [Plakobranchus ocellatus]
MNDSRHNVTRATCCAVHTSISSQVCRPSGQGNGGGARTLDEVLPSDLSQISIHPVTNSWDYLEDGFLLLEKREKAEYSRVWLSFCWRTKRCQTVNRVIHTISSIFTIVITIIITTINRYHFTTSINITIIIIILSPPLPQPSTTLSPLSLSPSPTPLPSPSPPPSIHHRHRHQYTITITPTITATIITTITTRNTIATITFSIPATPDIATTITTTIPTISANTNTTTTITLTTTTTTSLSQQESMRTIIKTGRISK